MAQIRSLWTTFLYCWFSITISEEPKVIGDDTGDLKRADVLKAKEWIRKNMAALLRVWEDEVDAFDAGLVMV